MDPPCGPAAAFVACALGFEGTRSAGGGVGVVADFAILLDGGETIGESLAGRAAVAVVLGVVAEVLLGEQAPLAVGGGVGFGDVRGDVFLKAGLHFLPVVIPPVGDDVDLVDAQGFLGALGHVAQ